VYRPCLRAGLRTFFNAVELGHYQMPKVLYSPAAINDLDNIWLFLATEADVETAERFLEKIEQSCEKITRSPVGFRKRPEIANDLRSFPFRSYVIFYFPEEYGINVVRIIHAAREIDDLLLN
jgi:toxin ParE1/3/4